MALKRRKSVMVRSERHRHARISERGPGEAVERAHFLCHLVEQALDGDKPVLPRDVIDQFVQEFPLRTGIAGRLDGLEETLHAALDVRERAALLGVSATRQKVVRRSGCLAWKNIADDERLQLSKQSGGYAVLRHVLAEDDERFDGAGLDAFGDVR